MPIEAQADRAGPSHADIMRRYGFARQFISEAGVVIRHFRETMYAGDGATFVGQFGGMTVAYRQEGNFLQLATAVCSAKDNYRSKLGTALAVERLANNQFILVPLRGANPGDLVADMFSSHFEDHSTLGPCGCAASDEDDDLQSGRLPGVLAFVVRSRPAPEPEPEAPGLGDIPEFLREPLGIRSAMLRASPPASLLSSLLQGALRGRDNSGASGGR